MKDFTLYHGDNLKTLKKLQNIQATLVYFDPPYKTGRDFRAKTGLHKEQQGFNDQFKNDNDYISFIQPRIEAAYKTLLPGGNLVVQCDDHANYLIKQTLLETFNAKKVNDEIIWIRSTPRKVTNGTQHCYGIQHDTIYRIAKQGAEPIFNPIKRNENTEQKKNRKARYKLQDEHGFYTWDRATTDKTCKNPEDERMQPWKGILPNNKQQNSNNNRHWTWSHKKMTAMFKIGEIKIENGVVLYKSRWNEDAPICGSVWNEISGRTFTKGTKLHWPTEKPAPLLDRIIQSYSTENSIVIDGFCGGGNLLLRSATNKRKYIGAEMEQAAVDVARERALRNNLKLQIINI